jgi:undecaprenyl-diphosphatase
MSDGAIIYFAQYLVAFSPIAFVVFSMTLGGSDRRHLYLLCAAALGAGYGVARLLGALYYDPRPFVQDGIMPLFPHAATNGLPSSHMLFAATLAMSVWTCDRRMGAALWVIALLVGAARVAAGVHHFIDIAGSALVAMAVVGTIERLRNLRRRRQHIVHQ